MFAILSWHTRLFVSLCHQILLWALLPSYVWLICSGGEHRTSRWCSTADHSYAPLLHAKKPGRRTHHLKMAECEHNERGLRRLMFTCNEEWQLSDKLTNLLGHSDIFVSFWWCCLSNMTTCIIRQVPSIRAKTELEMELQRESCICDDSQPSGCGGDGRTRSTVENR